jgi:hypothetical protein
MSSFRRKRASWQFKMQEVAESILADIAATKAAIQLYKMAKAS